ncbi:LuxR C-terminal-related transcriptional regulator [Aquisalimonas sp.]|uniref:response regulator transcription factor n=1 Tax=Aquisalimonas sp. TaxID=1872621 RepID=UPI0025BCD69B|nr:LuxR C-terminal-related transcriptional regulator [Aquisalimonas sp.]
MKATAKPSIAVVEEDPEILASLRQLLSSVHIDAEWFDSADALWAKGALSSRWQCVLADVGTAGVAGAHFIQQLPLYGINAPAILLLEPNDVPTAVEALKSGAADVLEKPFNGQMLLDAVHDAQRRARNASQSRERRRDLRAIFSDLTSREFDVAIALVRGLSNREIASALQISPKTVEVYRSRVMQKTQATSLCDLIRMAIKANLVEEEIKNVGAF